MERKQIAVFVLVALFAALIAAGAFIRIPFVPVAMTLQTLFAMIAAICLPPVMAAVSVLAYLLLGTVGLPIFTGGGGLAALLGPTGGYLIGMLPAVFAGSIVMKAFPSRPRIMAIVSSLITTAIIYAVGLPWLKIRMELSVEAMFVAGLVPFIAGDLLKIAVSSIAGLTARTRIAEMLNAS